MHRDGPRNPAELRCRVHSNTLGPPWPGGAAGITGETMQDGHNASASFREIDEHGNALPHDPASAPEDTRKIRVNPFIVALWVLNGALLTLSGWAFSESIQPAAYGAEMPGTVPVVFILMNVIPQLLLLSAFTTVALLFWHAWQWQKRRTA